MWNNLIFPFVINVINGALNWTKVDMLHVNTASILCDDKATLLIFKRPALLCHSSIQFVFNPVFLSYCFQSTSIGMDFFMGNEALQREPQLSAGCECHKSVWGVSWMCFLFSKAREWRLTIFDGRYVLLSDFLARLTCITFSFCIFTIRSLCFAL